MSRKYKPGIHFIRNRILLPAALRIAGVPAAAVKGYKYERYRPKSRVFLLLANHNEELDPLYEMVTFRQYIRYVSSDHVVRSGLKGRLLEFFGTPVVKYRERPGEELVRNIVDTLKAGVSVGLHAEGGMSFNGESRYISPHTAALIKEAGCSVITFRLTGGYMRKPRWGERRKGPLWGEVIHEYAPEEIQAMSEEEIYRKICCGDLKFNAYDEQRKKMQPYKGERLAEHCELILYRCPVCRGTGTLRSHDCILSCSCGYSVIMKEDGFFHDNGSGLVYDNICSWDHWQRESLGEYIDSLKNTGKALFSDSGQIVYRIADNTETLLFDSAWLEMYEDRFVVRQDGRVIEIAVKSVEKMDYVKKRTLLIVSSGEYLSIDSKTARSAIKYMDAWRYLTGRPNL